MTVSGSLLARLQTDRGAALPAAFPFGFDTLTTPPLRHVEPVWPASGEPLQAIAKDDGGGTYFLCGGGDGEDRPVLFADSEGACGVVGATLRDALLLLIALPCASEALHGERQGRVMDESALTALRAQGDDEYIEAADLEDLPGMRSELLDRLGLTPLPPLTELLELARTAAALNPSHVLLNAEGSAYDQG